MNITDASDSHDHRQYSLCYPLRDGQAELTYVAGYTVSY